MKFCAQYRKLSSYQKTQSIETSYIRQEQSISRELYGILNTASFFEHILQTYTLHHQNHRIKTTNMTVQNSDRKPSMYLKLTTHYSQSCAKYCHITKVKWCLKQAIHPEKEKWEFMLTIFPSFSQQTYPAIKYYDIQARKLPLTLSWKSSSKRSTCKHKSQLMPQKESSSIAWK